MVERLLQELQESRRAGKDVSSNSDSLTSTNKSVTWPWIHAPALFNHYAEALNWIMANNYGAQLLHYLDDDFLLVGPHPGKDTCHEVMSRVLLVCDLLGIPVASEKLEGPTTTLTFLGIVFDTSEQQLHLP
ncbi:hypothetical protein EMCRGX_G001494 [Ephydatia muelleri]